jgi:ubiquinone/menaquinone biosynthesis C-methylase UbiE
MDARLQLRVQRYGWDRAAVVYQQYWERQLAPAHQRLLAMADIQAGERVLDVACGSGLVTFPASVATGPGGFVFATDISEAMVRSVTLEAERRGLAQVHAERHAAEEARTPDQPFDVALCALGLMYVTDPLAVLRVMRASLRPGGRCVVAVWGSRKHCGWAEMFPIVERRVASEVCPLFFQLGGGDTLRLTMQEAGFDDILVDRIATTLEYDSAEDACGAAFAGGPVALAYSRFDANTRTAVHGEYLDSIAQWRHGDAFGVPGEYIVARGTVARETAPSARAPRAAGTVTPASSRRRR